MKALALVLLVVSSAASARELPSSRRLFVAVAVDAGSGLSDRTPIGGFGLALDFGQQVTNRFAWYVAARATTHIASHETMGLLMAERSVSQHWSLAAGAGTLAVFWAGTPDRGYLGLAIPARVSWDWSNVDDRKWVTMRVSLEAGVSPAGARFGAGTHGAPLFWGSVLLGSVWR